MKKSLLLFAIGCAASTAIAQTDDTFIRQVANDLYITHVSPNGRYMVSEVHGYLEIFDLWNGTKADYFGDEDAGEQYNFGYGNSISNNGVGVGSTTLNGNANVWENNVWTPLPVNNEALTNLAQGITPDASRICGQVGNAKMSLDATEIMSLPCYWERQADGSYAGPNMLPHPDLDLTGRVPQYVTALAISDDGHTIAGQVRDFSGMMVQPILYRQDAAGDWSYEMLFPEVANPDGIELPPYPGDAPEDGPQVQDFMTQEELDAYNQALQDWEAECNETGNWDYSKYPEMESFLSPEEAEAYQKAAAEFEKETEEWLEKYIPFQIAFEQLLESATVYLFNNVFLSGDGSAYASTIVEEAEDPNAWGGFSTNYVPVLMKVGENKEFIRLDAEEGMQTTGLTADNTVLAMTDGLQTPARAYLCPKGEGSWLSLEQWLKNTDPEVEEWFSDNTAHDIEIFTENGLEVLGDYPCTGMPVCTPDMTLFAASSEVLWESDESAYAESLIFTVKNLSGVQSVGASTGATDSVFYTLDGRRLKSAPASGLYIRQVRQADGSLKAEKLLAR